jgi:hypothetical protein
MNTGLLGENSQFTLGSVVNTGIETSITAGLTTVVYGGDYADNFSSSFSTSVLQLATADVQTLIGDQYNLKDENGNAIGPKEGSIGHVLTHAVVGCAAAEAQGGDCGAGAAAAGISAIIAGQVKDSGATYEEAQEWADEVTLISGIGAALTGADASDVQIAAGVGTSAYNNNYLHHDEAERRQNIIDALGECDGTGTCTATEVNDLRDELVELNALDAERDARFKMACLDTSSAACAVAFSDLSVAFDSYLPSQQDGTLLEPGIFSEFHSGDIGDLANVMDGAAGVADLYVYYKSDVLKNAYLNALQNIPVEAVTGAIDLASISAAAAAGDETAQQQLVVIGAAIAAAVTDPIGTVEAGYEKMLAQLEEAAALEAAGDWAGAADIIGGISANVTATALTGGVGGAAIKTIRVIPNAPNRVPDVPEGVPYYRVQGGGSGTAVSRDALTVNADGTVSITPGCTGTICVSAGSPDHAGYYISERRPDGNVVVFEVDRATHNQIMEVAVPQRNSAGAPVQIVDETTSGNATSLQLDQVHSQLVTNGSSNGRVLTQQEFLDEFGGN